MDLLLDWGWSFLNTFLSLGSALQTEISVFGSETTVGGLIFGATIGTLLVYKITKFLFGWIDIFT